MMHARELLLGKVSSSGPLQRRFKEANAFLKDCSTTGSIH